MKETKDFQLKMRVTKSEREQILEYCEIHKITISDLLRNAVRKILWAKQEN